MTHPLAVLATGACLLAAPAHAAWAPLGNPLSNMPGHQSRLAAAQGDFFIGANGSTIRGMHVVWEDLRSDGGDLYYSPVTDIPPADPAPGTDGIPLVVGAGAQRLPAIAAVGSVLIASGFRPQYSLFSPFVVAYQVDDFGPQVSREVRAVRVGDVDWGANGVPVHEPGELLGTDAAVTADDDYGAVVAWTENATGVRASRVQRLDAFGVRQWGANGVTLGSDTTVSSVHQVVRRTGGGTYVLRSDRRNGALTGAARAVALFLVDGAGVPAAGWPAEGLVLGDATTGPHELLSDGTGGAYVLWQQLEVLSNDALGHGVRIARVLADGSAAPGWSLAGTPVVIRADGRVRLGSAALRPDGGVVVALTYEQLVGGPADSGVDLVAQRMLPDGQLAPSWPVLGLDLCTAPGIQDGVKLIASGEALLAVWCDGRGGSVDLFGVKLANDGTVGSGWSADGNLLCGAPSEQRGLVLAPATGGGAVFAWQDERDFPSTQTDVYAQTVNALGQVDVPSGSPGMLSLSAAWPQPARESARLALSGPAGDALVQVLDTQGRTVTAWTEHASAGVTSLRWDLADREGRRVAPGVYHLRVRLGTASASRRIVVVR